MAANVRFDFGVFREILVLAPKTVLGVITRKTRKMNQNLPAATTPAHAHTHASGHHAAGPTSLTPTYSLPAVDDAALQATVAAILNLGGDVLPAPFNAEAQKEALSKIPVAEQTRNFQGLDLEALQRLVEAATLSNRLIYDLASMPVESREALDSETMDAFVASAMDSLATNVATDLALEKRIPC